MRTPELPFAPGSVTGIRSWFLPGSGQLRLRGVFGEWGPGENQASCHRGCDSPGAGCMCGFWAYWQRPPVQTAWFSFDLGRVVIGVVEGYGKTFIGDKGFRCSKARIIALCPQLPQSSDDERWNLRSGHAARTMALMAYEDELASRYQVPVYMSPRLMLARHPTTPPSREPEFR